MEDRGPSFNPDNELTKNKDTELISLEKIACSELDAFIVTNPIFDRLLTILHIIQYINLTENVFISNNYKSIA